MQFLLLTIGMLSGAEVTLASFTANIAAVTLGNTLGGIAIAAILFLIYLGKDQVQRSRPIFSQPTAATQSEPTGASAQQVEATVAEEPIQIAAVRLRLKSMHDGPATPAPKDPMRTKPAWRGPRSKG